MVTGMEKPYVVGMDIGGTNTVFGIVDQRGNVLATDSVKTQSYAKIEEYVEAVTSKLLPLIESVGGVEKIKGMGVGALTVIITTVLSSLLQTCQGRA